MTGLDNMLQMTRVKETIFNLQRIDDESKLGNALKLSDEDSEMIRNACGVLVHYLDELRRKNRREE